ncbi:myotubularin-related protein 10-B-like [Corticium candelabrum]|uniref:myotubularin-related protein 10-B-like n=1 Tax=Corticium candelabrum TaxID=121492 RepID=UPI002E261BDE|nr:myotubularin-related protein 10-B-like [Corticium candelabrum]
MLSILAVYAFPSSVSRVFAFDYASALARKQSLSFDVSNVQNFRSVQDFESELARLHALGSWRVSAANREFVLSETMPQFIVCPSTCKDSDLLSSAMLHKHGRIPMWCWSCPDTGVSLVRSACTRSRRSKRSSIFQALDSLSFSGKVHNLNLDKCCPVTREVQTSFGKLQELCQVKSIKEWHNDARWLSSLESARWLNSVKFKKVVENKDSDVLEITMGSLVFVTMVIGVTFLQSFEVTADEMCSVKQSRSLDLTIVWSNEGTSREQRCSSKVNSRPVLVTLESIFDHTWFGGGFTGCHFVICLHLVLHPFTLVVVDFSFLTPFNPSSVEWLSNFLSSLHYQPLITYFAPP